MPIVNGTLTDFGLDPLAGLSPVLQFRASAPGLYDLNVLPVSIAVEIEPGTNGYFEADLAATDLIQPPGVEYTVTVRYREPRTGYVKTEQMPWRFTVPQEGGALADLLAAPTNPAAVWTGTTPPDNPTPGTWWFNPETGELQEWSA